MGTTIFQGAAFAVVAALSIANSAESGAAESEYYYYGFQAEELEYRYTETSEQLLVWNLDAFYGTDELKLRLRTDGEYNLDATDLEASSLDLALQTPISDFWDAKGGVRYSYYNEDTDRWFASIGFAGLAPQWIEIDTDLYLSDRGQVSMTLDAEYELLITNYLILTPSAEIEMAFSSDEAIGSGSGVNTAELGLRLSYDVIDRSFSPYIGVVYERKFGQTAKFAQEEGERAGVWQAVIGTKLMF